ncbi:uncharacterized protein V1516DRAFT_691136 [Lipomyces oligophaga]|uniref:uncharacterized protein n=1 Tax=Lipomyces oligophaga TaxID=45792 RepID=UPI0034CEB8D4
MDSVDAEIQLAAQRHIVSAKDKKYDRQLRLWAANGQAALEDAHVLLLGASAAGSEILKNLVLPGTGSFTVADDRIVTEDELDVNFFLDEGSIGQPLAAQVSKLLQELNSDSKGHFESLDLHKLDSLEASFWERFSVVVAHQIRPSVLIRISKLLWEKNIPLVVSNSIGFYGYFRIIMPEHSVVESHPESTVDLRLDCPWPELEQFACGFNLENLDEMEHAHVPYLALLLLYMKRWRDAHDGNPPTSYSERNQFKDLIRSGMRSSDTENFEEAINAVWRATQITTVPSEISNILKDPRAQNLTEDSSKFWILTRAIADFVISSAGNGQLPLSGTVPDMKADTISYIKLQTIYRQKALQDRNWVAQRVGELLASLGHSVGDISTEEIDLFCKFARNLVVIDGRSLEEELSPSTAKSKLILSELEDENSLMGVYVGFKAVEKFEEQYDRYPGSLDDIGEDETMLAEIALAIVQSLGGSTLSSRLEKVLKEFVRSGGAELHNISSLIGGVGAQEIVKVITRQYVPIKNTVLFDGIQSSSSVWEL